MKKILVIATNNQGKLLEMKSLLSGTGYEISTPDDAGFSGEIEESGSTFRENAEIKAKTVGVKTKHLTVADDSGLEVDYLHGLPGVRSARFAPGTDADRYGKLLDKLRGLPDKDRKARFVSVIALYDPATDRTEFFEGESRGMITDEPRGDNGFGYDPVFYNTDLKKTNAEATPEEKNVVSHRARAMRKLKSYLQKSPVL